MIWKILKNTALYVVLTVIVISSLVIDYRQWKIKESDIKNSFGPPPMVSTSVEPFEIKDSSGRKIKSEELNNGTYMLVLWSMDEYGQYKAFFDELNNRFKGEASEKISIIPVNIGDKESEVIKFFKDNNYNFKYYLDNNKTVKWAFNKSDPSSIVYILDNKGIIKFRQQVGMDVFNKNVISKLSKYQ